MRIRFEIMVANGANVVEREDHASPCG
jgi:hypothetical protein